MKKYIPHNKLYLNVSEIINLILFEGKNVVEVSKIYGISIVPIRRIIKENIDVIKNQYLNNLKNIHNNTKVCDICYMPCNDFKGLGNHIQQHHRDITMKDYYDKYINQSDHICTTENCDNDCTFINLNLGYSKHCSCKCAGKNDEIIDKRKITNKKVYGLDFPQKLDYVKHKQQKTMMERYGSKSPMESEIIKKKHKRHFIEKYGVDNPSKLQFVKDKKIKTMSKNDSFNRSIIEDRVNNYFKINNYRFGRNYRSKKYPYSCDFFLKDFNLYIELNCHWTHHKEPFDPYNNYEHILILHDWVDKNTKYYRSAIDTWSRRDVMKKDTFIKNKLNHLIIYDNNFENIITEINKKTSEIYKHDVELIGDTKCEHVELKLSYTEKEMIDELNYYYAHGGELRYNSKNKIIKHFQQDIFYKKEKELWEDDRIREKLINNRVKYLKKSADKLFISQILSGFKISGIYRGYSHFNPLIIKHFIEKYNPKTIYDPCGGWGHRLLGSLSVNYIYNDIDCNTIAGVKSINDFIESKMKLKSNRIFYNNDASKFTPKEKYDSVFTCPPYYNLETYGKNSSESGYNYGDWINVWWDNLIKNSCKRELKYFSFIISDKLKDDMIKICIKNNLKVVEELIITKNNNHLISKNNKEFLIVTSSDNLQLLPWNINNDKKDNSFTYLG